MAIEYEGKFAKSINVERRKDSRNKKKFLTQRETSEERRFGRKNKREEKIW